MAQLSAWAGIVVFGFLGPQGAAAANVGLFLLLMGGVWSGGRFWRGLLREPLFWMFVALGVYAAWRASVAAAEFPSTAALQWTLAWNMFYPVLFLAASWCLGGDLRRVSFLLWAAALGFVVEMLGDFEWHNWHAILIGGERDDITGTALGTALYAAAGLLGIIALGPRVLRSALRRGGAIAWGGLIGLLLLFLIFVAAELITKSRAVWGAMAIIVPVVVFLQVLNHKDAVWRWLASCKGLLVSLAVLAISGVLIIAGISQIKTRWQGEASEIRQMWQSGFESVPKSSIGLRVRAVKFASNRIAERPWFGWGPGTSSTHFLAPRMGYPKFKLWGGDVFSDLHNTYLEVATRLGLVGLTLYLVIVLLVVRVLWLGYRASRMPFDIVVFAGAVLVLIGMWSVINYRLTNSDFRYFLILILAAAHTFTWSEPRRLADGRYGAAA